MIFYYPLYCIMHYVTTSEINRVLFHNLIWVFLMKIKAKYDEDHNLFLHPRILWFNWTYIGGRFFCL